MADDILIKYIYKAYFLLYLDARIDISKNFFLWVPFLKSNFLKTSTIFALK